MTPSSVDLLLRSRGRRVHFQSITTAQDLISGIFRVSMKMRLMSAAWLYRTLFRVLQKTVRVPDRAVVIAHGQESFYLFCSVTRVTKVSELFFPLKQVPLKIFKIVHVGTLVITHHNITYTIIMLLIKSGGKSPSASVTRVTSRESRHASHVLASINVFIL